MTEQETERERFAKAEQELIEFLGVSWKRQNSALTVHMYSPEFKLESLNPAHQSYRAHFAMDEAWDKLVKARAAADPLREELVQAVQSVVDVGFPFECTHGGNPADCEKCHLKWEHSLMSATLKCRAVLAKAKAGQP